MPIATKKSPHVTTVETKDPFDFVVPKVNENLVNAIKKFIEMFMDTTDLDTVRKLKEYLLLDLSSKKRTWI